jgi:proteasome assembly chaperone (PAC2) family protein
MGETHGGYIDTASARQITIMLSKYLDLKVNLKKLDERAAESQKVLKKVQDEVQKTMEAQNEALNRNVTYIR